MKNQQGIKCEWMARNEALANIDGQVYPCCYLQNSFTLRSIFQQRPTELHYGGFHWKKDEQTNSDEKIYLADEYFKYKDELNLMNNSLEDILNHEWFTKILPESWNDEKLTHKSCKKMCSVTSEKYIKNKSKSRN